MPLFTVPLSGYRPQNDMNGPSVAIRPPMPQHKDPRHLLASGGHAMGDLRLTLACGDYDLTRALIDGSVQPPGVELTVLPMPSPERHWRMMRFEEFDVAELSMSHYLVAHAEKREFTAI